MTQTSIRLASHLVRALTPSLEDWDPLRGHEPGTSQNIVDLWGTDFKKSFHNKDKGKNSMFKYLECVHRRIQHFCCIKEVKLLRVQILQSSFVPAIKW